MTPKAKTNKSKAASKVSGMISKHDPSCGSGKTRVSREVWLARDKDGDLYIGQSELSIDAEHGVVAEITSDKFPEIKPMEVWKGKIILGNEK